MPYCDLVEICILMFPQKSGGTNAPPLMELNCLLHQADQDQCHYAEHYAQYHRTLGQQFIHSFFLSPEKRFGSAGDRSRQTGALAGLENDRGNQRNRDDRFQDHQCCNQNFGTPLTLLVHFITRGFALTINFVTNILGLRAIQNKKRPGVKPGLVSR